MTDSGAAACAEVLDPIHEQLGPPVLSYGFAGPNLTRFIRGRIAPHLVQHAGHELRQDGLPICRRLGLAVDLAVPGRTTSAVARRSHANLRFDRMYLYGDDKPLHVRWGPEFTRQVVQLAPGPTGRLIPRRLTWA